MLIFIMQAKVDKMYDLNKMSHIKIYDTFLCKALCKNHLFLTNVIERSVRILLL